MSDRLLSKEDPEISRMGTEEGKNSPRSGIPRRIAFFSCLLLTASGVCLGIHGLLDAAGLDFPGTNHFPASFMQKNLPRPARLPRDRRIHQVAFLGDSTVISYDPGKTLPRQLSRALKRQGGSTPAGEGHFARPGRNGRLRLLLPGR